MMANTLPTCLYQWDGITDPRAPKPVERCANCGLPKTHPRHTLPPQHPDATELDQRKTGSE